MNDRRLVIRISADLTQVVFLKDKEKEKPLTPVPEGFSPCREVVIMVDKGKITCSSDLLSSENKGVPWEKITLHPSLGGKKIEELLKGG